MTRQPDGPSGGELIQQLEIMSGFAAAAMGLVLLFLVLLRPMSEAPWYAVAAVMLALLGALGGPIGAYQHGQWRNRAGLLILGIAALLALAGAFLSALGLVFVLIALLVLTATLLGAWAELHRS
jgi:hypothetical protein